MVMTRVNLRLFYLKKYIVTWHVMIVPHVKLTLVVFNLVLYLNFWFNLVSQFFKMIQFCALQFETKLIIKLNYNLYIHVKIFFYHLYIKSLPKYSYYFISYIFHL